MTRDEIEILKQNYSDFLNDKEKLKLLKKKIKKLEKLDVIKEYNECLKELDKLYSVYFHNDDKQSNAYFLSKAVKKTNITPTYDTYVYLGSYTYSLNPKDNCDRLLEFNDSETQYVLFKNIELPDCNDNHPIRLKLDEARKFILEHNIIFPKNTDNYSLYFYELQLNFYETMVYKSEEDALRLIKFPNN